MLCWRRPIPRHAESGRDASRAHLLVLIAIAHLHHREALEREARVVRS
jgi:hypothetical protein